MMLFAYQERENLNSFMNNKRKSVKPKIKTSSDDLTCAHTTQLTPTHLYII